MAQLRHVAPEFIAELEAALKHEGHDTVVKQLPDLLLGEVSIDRTLHIGYVRFQHPGLSEEQWAKAKESISTLTFAQPYWFNIDLDVSNRICGVELSDRDELLDKLASTK